MTDVSGIARRWQILAPSGENPSRSCCFLFYSCGMTSRLAEVAQKVGVSEATVSRVLNGRPGVSEATKTAVLTALDVLGYERPTQLRGERARLIGLVLPELQNPIFPAVAEVVGGALAQRGFTPVLCTRTAGGLSESDYVTMLLDQHVSGVVFAGGHFAEADAPHEHYHLLRERGIPVVLFNAAVEHLDLPQVSTDDTVAVEQAYGHLASLGHERIGLVVGPEDHAPSRRKLAAYREQCARHGRAADEELIEHAMFALEGGHAAATRLLRAGATGIICGSDPLALGAIRAVRRAGLRVPQDVSVVGFDDSAFMNCTDPPLTTVRQPIEALGRAAVTLLVNQIEGARVAAEELLFEPELVVRGSTGSVVARGGGAVGEVAAAES
jgi:DNA-binding LacI/PurR family transcriptional regulator